MSQNGALPRRRQRRHNLGMVTLWLLGSGGVFALWPRGRDLARAALRTRMADAPRETIERQDELPSSERVRQLRSRIASLRAQMVKQRREIDALTKELITEELRCASQASEEGEEKQILNRLFRSLGVLVHTAWKNGDPVSFVYNQTGTAIRVAGETAASGELIRDVLPNAPTLLSYAPGLYAHASRLDRHLPQILSVLDGYLPMVEPHLDVLIERFDDIEPHLEFCLEHADVVVPHLNEIVEYLDDILFFARERVLWTRLEPLLPQLVVRLPALGPHLPNLRRHAKLVLPYLPLLAHHADRLAPFLPISQHADALVHYLGWALQVPGLHRFLYLPGVGRALSYLAVRLPFSGAVREKSDMQHLYGT
ncbi:unnamed protein product [Durusdinium trenchii]|uniref:Uncharacterized protein n=1 Tax=Durusdinium trenchii TaxID=1381693 RepID=A0ABP0RMB7_9DINO